jgi:hypothetical protein
MDDAPLVAYFQRRVWQVKPNPSTKTITTPIQTDNPPVVVSNLEITGTLRQSGSFNYRWNVTPRLIVTPAKSF